MGLQKHTNTHTNTIEVSVNVIVTFEVSRREATPRIWFALIGWSNQFSRKSGTAVGTPNSRCHVLYKLLLMVCELWGHQQLYLIFQRPCHQLLGLATTFAERHETKKSWALIQVFWRKGWGLDGRYMYIYIYTRDYTRSPVVTMGWFGVGWGGVGMMTFLAPEHIFDATEMMSFLAHEHIFDATEHWGGVGWGGDDDVPCTWTHLWCYGDDVVPCTWTHLWCYRELGWGGVGWGWWRSLHMNTSLMLRKWFRSLHMNTSLMLRKNWGGWGGDDDVPCAWTHLWCYGDDVVPCKIIQVLAAAALRRKPGIMSVLNALQLYRNDCSSGKICVAPKDAFDPDSLSWLA